MALSLTYNSTLTSTTGATTYNSSNGFTDIVVPSDCLMILAIQGRGTASPRSVSSASIGGNATSVVTTNDNQSCAAIAYLAVAAGTLALSVTFSGSMARVACSVYFLTGYNSATPSDTDILTNASATSIAATLDFPTNGVAVYSHTHNNTSVTGWSAASEDNDQTLASATQVAVAHKTATGAGNTETPSWTNTTATAIAGAVWEEAAAGQPAARRYIGQQFRPLGIGREGALII